MSAETYGPAGQFGRQLAGQHRGPAQRRHRIAPLLWLNQGQQRPPQPRIGVSSPLAAPARPPRPAQRLSPGIQLIDPKRYRRLTDPRRPGHQPDPAMPQRPGLSPHQQPPLPLIQMREDHPKLAASISLVTVMVPIPHQRAPIPGSYGLIFCDS